MGNRAVVIFSDKKRERFSPAVYLHWNGGPESVYAFLDELDRRKVRADQEYECARFVQLVGEFFDKDKMSGLSLGVMNGPKSLDAEELVTLDPMDNGIYVVCREGGGNGWLKVRRFHTELGPWDEQRRDFEYRRLIEWSRQKVAREKAAAKRNAEYAEGIAEAFANITAGKPVEAL